MLLAGVLDDVHRGHREAGAVDEAADVAVERDVVQAGRGRLELDRVLLVLVLELGPVLVPELRVIVEVDLRIERDDVAVLEDGERVDLQERAILLHEGLVESGHQADELRDRLLAVLHQAEPERELARLVRGEADRGVDEDLEDLLRRVLGDVLDLHATLGGGDEGDAARVAIEHRAQVHLGHHLEALLDVEALHLLAFGAGLVRDQLHAEDLLGGGARIRGPALRDLHAAALAAATGVDLRLDDDELAAGLGDEALRSGLRLVDGEGGVSLGHRDAVLREDLLALILVDLHLWGRDASKRRPLREQPSRPSTHGPSTWGPARSP